jgi:RNA polymerase sigma-70 factor (ECF subfamily)
MKSFLFSTASYLWKSRKRKFARRDRLVPVVPFDETVESSFDIEDSVLAKEEIGIVRKLVESLPEKFKLPIIMYYTVEMSVPEIAFALKLPVGTVKSRLHKARKLIEKGLSINGY